MAETLSLIDNNIFATQEPNDRETPGAKSTEFSVPADKSPFRRIEFHPARKPFTGFTSRGGDGSFRLETLNPTTTSSKSNDCNQQSAGLNSLGGGSSAKKRDASELENGVDPELSFGITFRRIGAGLENLGNTCFLNSVLQCLTYTEPLAAYLQSGKHQVSCRKAGFCALCAIQKHVSRALQSSGRSLAPKDLVSNLRCISRTFRNSRQEDAHEYMVNLLESMHKCCLPTGVPSESQSAYDRSLVHKIFGGRLRSQVKCMQCNYCSNKFDPFLDLSLEILKADTLYKAFANFTAKEQLDGGAKQYQCQQCKQKVKALKQLTIHKAPNVLTIHLKRFGSHMSGQKIDKKIHFGSTLDLKPFVTGPYDGDLKYTLYGVLVHAGWSTHSGHYYCFVRTSSGMWYSLDDNRVFQVSETKVFEQKAYMLFYFRDTKNFPSKKPATDVIRQKEKIVINGTLNSPGAPKETQTNTSLSNGLLNGHKSLASIGTERSGFGPGAPKEAQTNTSVSNGLSNGHKSSAIGFSPGSPKETQTNTGLSNGLLNGHKSLASVGTERSGFGPGAPKETQTNTSLSNGLSNGHKSSAIRFSPGAPKETQTNTSLSNGLSNGHKSPATVGAERSGFSPGAPKEAQMNTGPSNGLLNDHKPSAIVGTERNGVSTGAPDQTQKKEGSGPKGVSESGLESPQTAKNEKGEPEKVKLPLIGENSQETGLRESIGGNSGCDGQNRVATTASDSLKTESLPEKKVRGRKAHKKTKNYLKCKATSMKICSNILMGAPRKKKKHKKSKRVKNLDHENPIDEGPSSSDKTKPSPLKAVKPSVQEEFKERVEKDGSALATGSGLTDCKRNTSKQKDLVHMLTRGLEDRTIPSWDDDDLVPSWLRETSSTPSIGYIGDEWDEEYDRGKRKKVRISSTEFDGKNPFQEIANERLKSNADKRNLSLKKPSMTEKNKHVSGNGPFRI